MKQMLKNIFFRFAAFFPMDMTGRASILMYHSVSSSNGYFFTVTPDEFRAQMAFLVQKGTEVISLSELAKRQREGKVKGGEVAITFDDGYKDNYDEAFPILKEFGFPATFFVTTGSIGAKGKQGEMMMNAEELKELEASGLIAIEPHSVTHPKLSSLSRADAYTEINESKEYLEKLLSKRCIIFAYPYGNFSEETEAVAKDIGFEAIVTVEEGTIGAETNPLRLKRNSIDKLTSWTQFQGKLSRVIDSYHSFKGS